MERDATASNVARHTTALWRWGAAPPSTATCCAILATREDRSQGQCDADIRHKADDQRVEKCRTQRVSRFIDRVRESIRSIERRRKVAAADAGLHERTIRRRYVRLIVVERLGQRFSASNPPRDGRVDPFEGRSGIRFEPTQSDFQRHASRGKRRKLVVPGNELVERGRLHKRRAARCDSAHQLLDARRPAICLTFSVNGRECPHRRGGDHSASRSISAWCSRSSRKASTSPLP
jgi:hypothetical protein